MVISSQPREPQAPVLGRRYTTVDVHRRADEPAVLLPALIQCFDDALRRFGVVELTGLQVTANYLKSSTGSYGDLVGTLNWFNTTLKGRADAIVALDQGLLRDHDVSALVNGLKRWDNGTFEFRSVVDVPEECRVEVSTSDFLHPVTPQSPHGVLVSLPEWTPSAVGWVLASVINAARALESDTSSFAIRITRV